MCPAIVKSESRVQASDATTFLSTPRTGYLFSNNGMSQSTIAVNKAPLAGWQYHCRQ